VGRWLAACVGCGMCEQACPREMPLTALHDRLATFVRREATLERWAAARRGREPLALQIKATRRASNRCSKSCSLNPGRRSHAAGC
jgi:ferredoxin